MNNDLISRSALLTDIQADVEEGGLGGMVAGALKRYVRRAPAVKAVPVRYGRWERTADGAALCTACKRKMNPSQYGYAFCSLCGAIMDGGQNNETY